MIFNLALVAADSTGRRVTVGKASPIYYFEWLLKCNDAFTHEKQSLADLTKLVIHWKIID